MIRQSFRKRACPLSDSLWICGHLAQRALGGGVCQVDRALRTLLIDLTQREYANASALVINDHEGTRHE
jgi:hypothetical protein